MDFNNGIEIGVIVNGKLSVDEYRIYNNNTIIYKGKKDKYNIILRKKKLEKIIKNSDDL